jgi:hypothetical protein
LTGCVTKGRAIKNNFLPCREVTPSRRQLPSESVNIGIIGLKTMSEFNDEINIKNNYHEAARSFISFLQNVATNYNVRINYKILDNVRAIGYTKKHKTIKFKKIYLKIKLVPNAKVDAFYQVMPGAKVDAFF